jgi:hypothetical protein
MHRLWHAAASLARTPYGCSHVNTLVPPLEFGQRMAEVTKKMLLRMLQNLFVDGLLPEARCATL